VFETGVRSLSLARAAVLAFAVALRGRLVAAGESLSQPLIGARGWSETAASVVEPRAKTHGCSAAETAAR
jgi:hypothetical protein